MWGLFCSLIMLIIAQWDLFMWISVYNDWSIEFIKPGRTFLSLYWYCSSQGFTSLYWAIEFLQSCHVLLEIPILRCIKLHKYASVNANVDLHSIIILLFLSCFDFCCNNWPHWCFYMSFLACKHGSSNSKGLRKTEKMLWSIEWNESAGLSFVLLFFLNMQANISNSFVHFNILL